MNLWQLDLLPFPKHMLLTAKFMSTHAKHHKPSNRSSCLIQCTCNSYNTGRSAVFHICWLCPQAWSTQIEYGTLTTCVIPRAYRAAKRLDKPLVILCVVLHARQLSSKVHIQIDNLAMCMLKWRQTSKINQIWNHPNVQGCLCHCQKTASIF